MKTSAKENGLEVKVGLFLCIGLLIIAAMILQFGLGGKQGIFKKYYPLVVDLPDADGLLKNSKVQLGGAPIGYVSTKPVLTKSLGTVRVILNVDDSVKIPIGSTFEVGSSGLLGDKYVIVTTAPGFKPDSFNRDDPSQSYQPPQDPKKPDLKVYDPSKQPYVDQWPQLKYEPGDAIQGEQTAGIPEAVKKLSDEIDSVKLITTDLQNGILSGSNQKNVVDMIANLNDMSANLKKNVNEAAGKLPGIMTGAQGVVDKANKTMTSVDSAADNLNGTLQTFRDFIDKASHGEGLIGQLVNNRQLADNFNALIANMKEHGPVFYHDTAKKNPPPTPTPRDSRQR
ncbi:MAG TPA: MlaD family protein [Chthoniobacteraceae bacterium]|nr:MlaD family protein [Chthoniobacteraceae bacterium]